MAYNQKHRETEKAETIRILKQRHPELIIDDKNFDKSKYIDEEKLSFSTATNSYDIPSDDTVIMRYMNLKKFKDIIENSELYMSSPKNFSQDCCEGYVIPNVGEYIQYGLETFYKNNKELIQNKNVNISGIKFTGIEHIDKKIMKDRCSKIYKHHLKRFFISCWTERTVDQDNMWRAYIPSEEDRKTAIALKTTVGKLKQALHNNKRLFTITRVKYVNFDTYKVDKIDFLGGGMWALAGYMLNLKDENFADDHEIRLFCDDLMTNQTDWYKAGVMCMLGAANFDYSAEPNCRAKRVPIDLSNFIDEIIISPSADDSFTNEIKDILHQKNITNVKVNKSKINKARLLYWDK